MELLDDPNAAIDDLGKKLGDVGLATYVELLENLPSASKGNDGEGDMIDNTIGAVLDVISEEIPLGILPSMENAGGYITQIATQLFGDNRAGIVVEDKSKLEAITTVDGERLKERKPGDSAKDWDYEKVIMVKTEDGIKPISEVKNPEGLEQVTKYRTNPDKQLVIEDGTDRSGNPTLEDYKIRISQDDIEALGINHLFTNGMFNNHDTAVFNQQTQQQGADAILNYNQQHGVIGDLLESGQDAIASNGADMLYQTLTLGQTDNHIDGISTIGTGGARQTGEIIVQMSDTNIRNGDITVGAHSQGTLMTQVGMSQQQKDLETLVQSNQYAEFLVQYSGSPVNHYIAEALMTDIYGGEAALENRLDGTIEEGIINEVFRSQVAPEDFVGSGLGYQSAGINNSENLGENMGASTLSIGRLLGVGGGSTHSYYGCVIGCGEENFTPDIRNYANPDASADPKELPVEHYYETNFIVKDENGHDKVDVNLDLLPIAQRKSDTDSKKTIILDVKGGE